MECLNLLVQLENEMREDVGTAVMRNGGGKERSKARGKETSTFQLST